MEHEKLNAWREEMGLTIADVARAIGMDYNYVTMIFRGDRRVTSGFRWRFGLAYGFDVATELFGDNGPHRPKPAENQVRTQ